MSEYFDRLKSQWLPVCKSSTLKKKPRHVQVLGEDVVVFRVEDSLSALSDRCPHRNVPLSAGRVVRDCIQCPYHGWRFDRTGACQEIPGTNPAEACRPYKVPSFDVTEKAGLIWVRMKSNDDSSELRLSDHIVSKAYSSQIWSDEINANLINAVENFLDGTHTHFVHSGLVRSEQKRKEIIADITPLSDRVEIIYKNEGKQNGVISKWFEPERNESKASFIKPCLAELTYSDKKGIYFAVSAYLVPESDTRLKVFAFLSHRKNFIPSFIKHLVVYPFFKAVLLQDKRILKMQQACVDRFGKERFIVTELDVMRPYVHRLLLGEDIQASPRVEKTIYL